MVVVYPVFNNFANVIDDKYWKEVFLKFSSGKFPKGIKCDNEKMIINVNGKYTIIKFNDNNDKVFNSIITILREQLNMKSDIDINKKKEKFNKIREQNETKIKYNKIIKKTLLIDYICYCKTHYKLSLEETNNLYSLIKLGIFFKSIRSSDFVYENNKIKKIKGVTFIQKGTTKRDSYNKEYDIKCNNYIVSLFKPAFFIEKTIQGENVNLELLITKYLKDFNMQLVNGQKRCV